MFFYLAFFSFLHFYPMQMHPILKPYHWENRILITFSPDIGHHKYAKQKSIFSNNTSAIKERDLVLFEIFPIKGENPQQKQMSQHEVESLRDHYNIDSKEYKLLLIGKDGTVKKTYNQVVPMENIIKVIDAMPMRQREMRKN